MAAYLQDEEGLGSSVGAAFLGLCVCCFLPPPSVVVWVLCFSRPPARGGVAISNRGVVCVTSWQGR